MRFESSVNSDGTQTSFEYVLSPTTFESSVNSDGTQTYLTDVQLWEKFESSVNSDGTQTIIHSHYTNLRLRVV